MLGARRPVGKGRSSPRRIRAIRCQPKEARLASRDHLHRARVTVSETSSAALLSDGKRCGHMDCVAALLRPGNSLGDPRSVESEPMETTQAMRPDSPVLGDQRPPRAGSASPRVPVPRSAMRKSDDSRSNASLVNALGWFSIGLGLSQLLVPRGLSRAIGAEDEHAGLVRGLGVRELATGVGLLSGREPQMFLWARVAGDLMDLALLGNTIASGRDRGRALGATAAVAAVTALDVYAANRVRQEGVGEPAVDERTLTVEKTLAINRSPQECYDMWRAVENFPRFMEFVDSVTPIGQNRFHWVARSPGGARIEWDSEITNDQPGRLIAWRSVDEADVEHAGVVRFEPGRDGRGTWLRVEMQYRPPGGALGAMLARIANAAPKQAIEEDIRRFKRLMETGEVPTIEGQPHGRRSMFYGLMRKGRA
jgi:uncharacterized membrane protein